MKRKSLKVNAALNVIKIQNTVFDKFINIKNGITINGAGLVDVTVKVWGYVMFSCVLIGCLILAIIYLKQK